MFTLQNFTCLHFSTLHVYTAVHYMFTLQYITCQHCSLLYVYTAVQWNKKNCSTLHVYTAVHYKDKRQDKISAILFIFYVDEANISLELENQLIKKIKFIIAVFLVHGNK